MPRHLSIIFTILFLSACMGRNDQANQEKYYSNNSTKEFNEYWYSGNAELNSYALEEARYGEIRNGEAVLIFVTEDFLTEKQVKKESKTEAHHTSVLKLNYIKKFTTGIYDYSLMSSIFSPVKQDQLTFPIKVSTSSQEWCGHSWMQLNETAQHYHLQAYSYFEKESDVNRLLNKTLTEDGLWNQIRLNPKLIPQGEVQIIPSTQYLRLSHKDSKAYLAEINIIEENDSLQKQTLTINYPELGRRLSITFEKAFPHRILTWTENKMSGGKQLQTNARLKVSLKSPYWNQNKLSDSTYRKELNITH